VPAGVSEGMPALLGIAVGRARVVAGGRAVGRVGRRVTAAGCGSSIFAAAPLASARDAKRPRLARSAVATRVQGASVPAGGAWSVKRDRYTAAGAAARVQGGKAE
jgi:hypothetical protein